MVAGPGDDALLFIVQLFYRLGKAPFPECHRENGHESLDDARARRLRQLTAAIDGLLRVRRHEPSVFLAHRTGHTPIV